MPYQRGDCVRILRKLSGRNTFGEKRVTARAGSLGTVWLESGDGWYDVEFQRPRAIGLAGLYIHETDLAPCTEDEASMEAMQRREGAARAEAAALRAKKLRMIRKPEIEDLDVIRLTVPLKGSDVFDDKAVYKLPVGTEGTVVHVFGDGAAFEVEFILFPEPEDHDHFVSVQIPVEAYQCELAWKLPPENAEDS
ncbi:MAG: DUF4926 domain-containing protein [Desulfovibrio sp.]|nr:DUF4926 domain-containing protein [Desulfovibrio sp.]